MGTTPRGLRVATCLALLGALVLGGGCHYHGFVPDLPEFWDIRVENRTGIGLDIYLDGRYRVSMTDGTVATLPGIQRGSHVLEAYDFDGVLRASRSIYLDRDFIWILE